MFVAYILLYNVATPWILVSVYRVLPALSSSCVTTLSLRLIGMIVFLNLLCYPGTSHEAFVVLILGITLIEVLSLEILTCS